MPVYKKAVCYKWCRISPDGKYTSLFTPDSFTLNYAVGKITHPIKGSLGLFVFDDLNASIKYKPPWSAWNELVLLECRVQGPAYEIHRVINLMTYTQVKFTDRLPAPSFSKQAKYLHNLVIHKRARRQRRITEINKHEFLNGVMLTSYPHVYSVALVKPVKVVITK